VLVRSLEHGIDVASKLAEGVILAVPNVCFAGTRSSESAATKPDGQAKCLLLLIEALLMQRPKNKMNLGQLAI